jgi:hypothetical protein
MLDAAHHARPTRKLVGVVLAAVAALVVPAVAVAAPPADKGPAPSEGLATKIRIDSVLDGAAGAGLPTTPGTAGLAYVVALRPFDVTVTFLDDTGVPAPLSENKDVDITLLVDGVVEGTETVPATEDAWAFADVVIDTPASGLRMVVRADTKPKAISSPPRTFDVLIADAPVNTQGRSSVGGNGGADGCNPVAPDALTPGKSVCADLLPPFEGSFGPGGTLSQGVCGNDCEGSYIQALVDFGADPSDPSTLIMKCDKEECGVGPIRRQVVEVNLSPAGDDELNEDVPAPACPSKGVVEYYPGLPYEDGNRPFCIDYVQSTRDNAGDTFLYLLFVVDAKVRFL